MNKSNDPILSPKIQPLIVYLYTKMKCLVLIVPGKSVTQIYLEKTEKCINKGMNKSNEPDSLSHHTIIHHPYVNQAQRL